MQLIRNALYIAYYHSRNTITGLNNVRVPIYMYNVLDMMDSTLVEGLDPLD